MHHQVLKPNYSRKDERGLFVEALNGSPWEQISYGKMQNGATMGNHYHKETSVFFFLVDGSVQIDIVSVRLDEKETLSLNPNEGVILVPNYSHAIRFREDSTFVMGKSKKYDKDNPDTYPLEVPEL